MPHVFAQQHTKPQTTPDGMVVIDPEETLAAVVACVDIVLQHAAERANQIMAVAVDTLVSNMIVVDAAGKPLTPMILYADTRNAEDAVRLQAQLDEHAIHQRTGCLLRTSYWPARLAWLKRTQPNVWKHAAHFVTLGEYLEARLFGRSRISTSVGSWTGMLNRQSLTWDNELVQALGVSGEQLGMLVDASMPQRGLQQPFRARWPVLADVPWFPAIGDGAAANLGSGCTDERTMALTVGTTGALRIVRREVAKVPRGLWCYRVDAKRALLGGATSEGGNVFGWMHGLLQLGPDELLEQQIAAMPPDGHGLTVLPFLAGERSPGWAGDAKATISGLTLSTTPLDMLRAGLEAVAFRFAMIATVMVDPASPPTIIASGGALLRSPTWLQICADALGVPITASTEAEATCRGIALLALESLGVIPNAAALPAATGQTYVPNSQHHAIYQAASERQQQLYALLIR